MLGLPGNVRSVLLKKRLPIRAPHLVPGRDGMNFTRHIIEKFNNVRIFLRHFRHKEHLLRSTVDLQEVSIPDCFREWERLEIRQKASSYEFLLRGRAKIAKFPFCQDFLRDCKKFCRKSEIFGRRKPPPSPS